MSGNKLQIDGPATEKARDQTYSVSTVVDDYNYIKRFYYNDFGLVPSFSGLICFKPNLNMIRYNTGNYNGFISGV